MRRDHQEQSGETTSPATQTLSFSRLATFRKCPRLHWMVYELGLEPETDSLALEVGKMVHLALEMDDRGKSLEIPWSRVEDPFRRGLARAMFDAYLHRWAEPERPPDPLDPIEALDIEVPYNLPLVNPETNFPTPNWRLSGRMDRRVRLRDGRIALWEYKTTSRNFDPGSDYRIALRMDGQPSGYVNASRAMGSPVDVIVYDMIRRPMLRPLEATPVEKRRITKAGLLDARQRERDETADEYEVRVFNDLVEDPNAFQRIEVARLDQDLLEYQEEVWQQQLAIRSCQRSGHWWRNPASCFAPIPCDYLGICQNRDLETVTPPGFVRKKRDTPLAETL